MSVKGGVGYVVEWGGPGIDSLSVPERATITNMGTELGATTSIFPSDEVTYEFLKAQGREKDWIPLASDEDAVYDEEITIDLYVEYMDGWDVVESHGESITFEPNAIV